MQTLWLLVAMVIAAHRLNVHPYPSTSSAGIACRDMTPRDFGYVGLKLLGIWCGLAGMIIVFSLPELIAFQRSSDITILISPNYTRLTVGALVATILLTRADRLSTWLFPAEFPSRITREQGHGTQETLQNSSKVFVRRDVVSERLQAVSQRLKECWDLITFRSRAGTRFRMTPRDFGYVGLKLLGLWFGFGGVMILVNLPGILAHQGILVTLPRPTVRVLVAAILLTRADQLSTWLFPGGPSVLSRGEASAPEGLARRDIFVASIYLIGLSLVVLNVAELLSLLALFVVDLAQQDRDLVWHFTFPVLQSYYLRGIFYPFVIAGFGLLLVLRAERLTTRLNSLVTRRKGSPDNPSTRMT